MVLAPMANVTDAAFRHMFAGYHRAMPPAARPVLYTEFVSVEGLLSRGRERLLPDLWFNKGGAFGADADEHPIVAQIFGAKPEQFARAAAMVAAMGFDGIDINMGCPDRAVERQGAGAALIKTPALAQAIIRATKEGAGGLPVSVKTRIGWNTEQLDEWIPAILEERPAALIVHLRTRKEMSKVPAHWDLAPKLVALRDAHSSPDPDGKGGTLIFGNGDVASLAEAHARAEDHGLDGVMIGRGAFGAPWFFTGQVPPLRERLARMVEHTELFEALYGSDRAKSDGKLKNFDVMKKHYKAYCAGFDGAKELRTQLMEEKNAAAVRKAVEAFFGDTP
jgi:tRNA-dihydrouridine synthase